MLLFISVTFVLAPTLSVYEILIEHTPITKIPIEHTLISINLQTRGKNKLQCTYEAFLPMLFCTSVAFLKWYISKDCLYFSKNPSPKHHLKSKHNLHI